METLLSVPFKSHSLVCLQIQNSTACGSSSPTTRRAGGVFVEYLGPASSRCNLIERPTTPSSDSGSARK